MILAISVIALIISALTALVGAVVIRFENVQEFIMHPFGVMVPNSLKAQERISDWSAKVSVILLPIPAVLAVNVSEVVDSIDKIYVFVAMFVPVTNIPGTILEVLKLPVVVTVGDDAENEQLDTFIERELPLRFAEYKLKNEQL